MMGFQFFLLGLSSYFDLLDKKLRRDGIAEYVDATMSKESYCRLVA